MSILPCLTDKTCWLEYFAYKKEGGNLSAAEEKDLLQFIENEEYLPLASDVLAGRPFPLPSVKELNKKHSDKKRKVFIFPRAANYLLKLLAYLLYRYDGLFSDNLYSFRRDTGVKKAISRFSRARSVTSQFSYKVDIHDYFNSVDPFQMCEIVRQSLSDDPALTEFIASLLLEPRCLCRGTAQECRKGIMAGMPISGFLANLYLKDMDEWFASQKAVYARYSDDIIVFAETAEQIRAYECQIRDFLARKGLEVNPKKEVSTVPGKTWEYLGFCYDGKNIDLAAVAIEKIKGKMRRKARALVRWKQKKGASDERAIAAFIRQFNRKLYDNPCRHEVTWCRWYFPTITTADSLNQIDAYAISCIRYIATGKHTKANYNLRYSQIKELGFRSLVNAYYAYQKQTLRDKK